MVRGGLAVKVATFYIRLHKLQSQLADVSILTAQFRDDTPLLSKVEPGIHKA